MTTSLFGTISHDEFLREYWQKKPLLIRGAFANFQSPISPDELAGLSLEEESQSRLIIQNPKKNKNQWTVKHGPLDESEFDTLPETNWTLLVQHADALHPDVNATLQKFRFLPNWRLDDIMISFATDGGGVGPHFDYYDVFLLQADGKRRWRTGQQCNQQSALLADQDMQILKDFETVNDWLVEPGDLLYIPAQIAHWGEAIGHSETWSIGFRAPSNSELLLDLSQQLAADLAEDQRYTDGQEILQQKHNGEISSASIQRIQKQLHELIDKPEAIANWLGTYATNLNPALDELELDLAYLESDDLEHSPFRLSPFARCAFYGEGPQVTCFINGQIYYCDTTLAQNLSGYEALNMKKIKAQDQEFIYELCDLGLLIEI